MVREAEHVGASQTVFTLGESAGLISSADDEPTQFAVKLLREFWPGRRAIVFRGHLHVGGPLSDAG